MKKALVALTMMIASGTVFAAEGDEKLYVSGSIGQSMIDADADEDIGFKFSAGYAFSTNFAVEGGWARTGASESAGGMEAELTIDSFYAAAVGMFPVNNELSLHGKLGLSMNRMEFEVSGGGMSMSESDSETELMFGIGGAYKFNPNMSIIAEYERFEDDVALLSAGLRYTF